MFKPLFFLLIVACGVSDNKNTIEFSRSSSETISNAKSSEDTLGFNAESRTINYRMITGSDTTDSESLAKMENINQYIRFNRGKNRCSGVLSWEWEAPNDIYLYTARHCFEKSDPIRGVQWDFDLVSNSKPLIDEAFGFEYQQQKCDSSEKCKEFNLKKIPFPVHSDKIEVLKLNQQVIPSGFGKNRAENTQDADVVRLYQFTLDKGPNPFEKICDSGELIRSGHRGTLGFADPKLRFPDGVSKSVSNVEYDLLNAKLTKWLPGSKLDISSQLVKLANTTTLPGESGSPVFVATRSYVSYTLDPRSFQLGCVDGIMTREITKLGQPSEAFYNVMSFSGTSRSWSKVWSLNSNGPSKRSAPTLTASHASNSKNSPSALATSVATPPRGITLSLIDQPSGHVAKSASVSRDSNQSDECDNLVRTSYAKTSSGDFDCFADGKLVKGFEAPGYDGRFR